MTEIAEKTNREGARKRGQKISAGEIDKLIGMRIRIARNMAGKKQDELAQYLGLTLQQAQKYENGKNKISVNILIKIAKYFQIPVSYFIPANNSVGSTAGQTMKMLETMDTATMQNVAEEWKPIKHAEGEQKNMEELIEQIKNKGLEGQLRELLNQMLNSK